MIISFLSDFGLVDEFVGVVHGVIARIAPEVKVIDVGHDLPRGEVLPAALAMLRAIQYLPQGVMLAVVDPGVGTERRAIVADTPWGYFVGPDNGLMTPAIAMVGGTERVVSIENERFRIPAAGATFHGRDVFAPAAAVLANGESSLDDLGPEVDPASLVPIILPLVEPDDIGGLRCEVLWVDHFGNAQTNASPEDLAGIGVSPGDDVVVTVGSSEFRLVWVTAYGDVESGEAMIHVDSYGQIAISVRDGRADEDLPIGERTAVSIRRPSGGSRIPLHGVSPVD